MTLQAKKSHPPGGGGGGYPFRRQTRGPQTAPPPLAPGSRPAGLRHRQGSDPADEEWSRIATPLRRRRKPRLGTRETPNATRYMARSRGARRTLPKDFRASANRLSPFPAFRSADAAPRHP